MIARSDRPAYRVTAAEDGCWTVDELPSVSVTATGRREALDEARAATAEWLEVDPDAFDVESQIQGKERPSGRR
jgi:predicted RNase H-like HicB family nuclease